MFGRFRGLKNFIKNKKSEEKMQAKNLEKITEKTILKFPLIVYDKNGAPIYKILSMNYTTYIMEYHYYYDRVEGNLETHKFKNKNELGTFLLTDGFYTKIKWIKQVSLP